MDEWLPWPLESGKKIRTFNLMVRLAKKHQILYMGYATLPQESEKVSALENHGIRVIPVKDCRTKRRSCRFYLEVFTNIFSKEPFSTFYHIKPQFSEKLMHIIKNEHPNLVHCEWSNLAPFLKYIRNVPAVISAHNIESVIWKRLARNTSNPLLRFIARQQANRIEQIERKWYPLISHCIAVSEEDSDVIKSYGARVTVVENGVDMEYYNWREDTEHENTIVFTASFDTFSNQDAVDYFIKEIFPFIKIRNPDATLWLVGKEPTKKIRKYGEEDGNVHVTGTVPDVRPFISRASLCIVPLRIGGGSRLKILEAMAMRKPVVSTSVGAEGLRVADGKNIILVDTPRDFADKVLWLLADRPAQISLGNAGRELVNSYYRWESLCEKQSEVWQSVLLSV